MNARRDPFAIAAALIVLTAAGELPTPMNDRVATIGALDKRTGTARDFPLRPGETARFGALTIRLRACETTPPWQLASESGGFVQLDQDLKKGGTRRVFSGWLFARSPSLDPFEDPNYDVWLKACATRFPETGPDTVAAGADTPSPATASKAKKSPRLPIASASNAR